MKIDRKIKEKIKVGGDREPFEFYDQKSSKMVTLKRTKDGLLGQGFCPLSCYFWKYHKDSKDKSIRNRLKYYVSRELPCAMLDCDMLKMSLDEGKAGFIGSIFYEKVDED